MARRQPNILVRAVRALLSVGRAVMPGRQVRAKYDAAQTVDGNRRHWANADALSPDAANSSSVRSYLRNRARYEVANNGYLGGLVTTLANDTVGTGPRLQLLNKAQAQEIERSFMDWARKVGLAKKLRTMSRAWTVDGEAFAIKTTNPKLAHAVKLDLRLVEAEQVASPVVNVADPNAALLDGITLDTYGNPATYSVAKVHPGSGTYLSIQAGDYETIRAEDVIHLFTAERPGQHRGVPRILASLPLGSILRRFTLATVVSAETAAEIAAVTYTDSPPNDEAVEVKPLETYELERGMAMTLPAGWKIGQVAADHPATTYPDFKRELLAEIARPLSMPFNIAACDSSRYNYASGRLDHKTYYRAISVDQAHIETEVLERVFEAWAREYSLVTGRAVATEHEWYWSGDEHVDPVKEATAQQIRLEAGTTTLKDECAAQGQDWEKVIEQRALEHAKLKLADLLPAPPSVPKQSQQPDPALDPEELPEEAIQ